MLYNFLKQKIEGKKLVLFGEIHGTKEIPEMLSEFFEKYAKDHDFNICMEIPSENQRWIDNFLLIGQDSYLKEMPFFKYSNSDGRNSLEYFNLIKNIYKVGLKIAKDIKIFCIDSSNLEDYKDQNEREIIIANNIKKVYLDRTTFIIIGNIHASKNVINLQASKIIPVCYHLLNEFKDKLVSINFMPKAGRFFNIKIQDVEYSDDFNKNFDYNYIIEKVSPCSFLE